MCTAGKESTPHHNTLDWPRRTQPSSLRPRLCSQGTVCALCESAEGGLCYAYAPLHGRHTAAGSAWRDAVRSPASLASPLSSVSSAPAPLHAPPGGTDSRSVRRRVAFAVRGGSAVFAESLMTSSLGRRTRRTPTRRRGQGTRAGTRAGTRPRTTTQRRGRGRGGVEEETTAKEAEAPWEPRGCWPFGVWAGAAATSPSLRKRRRAVQGEDNAADMGGG